MLNLNVTQSQKKESFIKKSGSVISVSCNFCYPSFLFGSILSPHGDYLLATKPFVLSQNI